MSLNLESRKIKLVVSDFHLGAGHHNPDGSINILEDFFHDREFIEFLDFFSSGVNEAKEVELIVNGDFFNILQIDFNEVDPDVVTELVALHRMKKIMDGHRAVMNALRHFQSVELKSISFILGNHDPGILFSSVQDLIKDYCGENCRFFLDHYEFDGIYIEHGNQYEVANAFDRSKYFLTRALPQPVLNQPWGTYFLINVINTVKRDRRHFDKVQPLGRLLKWTLIQDPKFFFKVLWMIIKFFFRSRFSSDPRKSTSIHETLKILLEAPVFPDLDEAAERILMTRDEVHTVIFGHNHRPTFRQFAPGKEYINTGTWNEVTNLELDRMGTRLQCTFALLEYLDDRIHSSLKVWNGKAKLQIEADVA